MAKSTNEHPERSSRGSPESNERLEVKVTLSGRISVDPVDVLRSVAMERTLKKLEVFKIRETS